MGITSFVKLPGKATDRPIAENPTTKDRSAKRLCYARVLSGLDESNPSEPVCQKAWTTLQQDMAMIPAGQTILISESFSEPDVENIDLESVQQSRPSDVGAYFIDRYAVTNADFHQFVKSGGYEDLNLWPEMIWPNVVQFLDQTGHAGPRWWSSGKPSRDQLDHPVVGVCWFEALAFANWVGKRLPVSAEWQRAGCWHSSPDGKQQAMKYPWGNAFEKDLSNTWLSSIGKTVPVDHYVDGCTPNGIFQLIGNVWEWTNSRFECCPSENPADSLGEIRGGAFDTYFPSQVTCQFRTGQPLLFRAPNIGFRCCVPISQLTHVPGKSDCQLM